MTKNVRVFVKWFCEYCRHNGCLLKWSLFRARALERHKLLGRSLPLSIRGFMCSQNNELWFILVFGKTSRNFTR